MKNNETTHGINRWLRRIFSLEFLGVVIGAIGLYFTYDTFLKEKPGEIRMYNEKQKFSSDIRYVFYGFEIKGDSLNLLRAKNFPHLANYSSNPVNDFTMLSNMDNNLGCTINERYKHEVAVDDSLSFPQLRMASFHERVGYMGVVPFPIETIETRTDEVLIQHILLSYMYQGMKEDIVNLHYYLVGIPPHYRDDDGREISSEKYFIKAIRPYLLMIEDYNQILLLFGNKIVEAPKNIELLDEKEIKVETINELQ